MRGDNLHDQKVQDIEISLAFPEGEFSEKEPCFVYSGFQVNDMGFKFVINADFVLTTNKEGIQENSKWNSMLRDKICLFLIFLFTVEDEHLKKLGSICSKSTEKNKGSR